MIEWDEAHFKSGDSKNNLTGQLLKSCYIPDLIENVSKFLDCEIDERHYIIK